jgi:putative inorganic carbon (hco3(-)) transporter
MNAGGEGRAWTGVAGVATLAALAGLWAFAAFAFAATRPGSVEALAVVLAVPFLLAAALWPPLLIASLAAVLLANAGLVLNEQFGVPSVVRALAILGLAVALVRPSLRAHLLAPNPVIWALLAFVGARLAATLLAPRPVDIDGTARDLLFGLAIVAVLRLAAIRWAWTRLTAAAVVTAAGLLSVLALARDFGWVTTTYGFAEYQRLTPDLIDIAQRSLAPVESSLRIGGPVAEPNFWAQILVLSAPLALWAVRWGPRRLRPAAAAAAVAILACILVTGSRGGIVALGVAGLVLAVATGGRMRRLALLIPVAIVGAVVMFGDTERFAAIGDLTEVSRSEDEALRGRASENLAAVKMFEDHPLTGVGAGNYADLYRVYAGPIGLDARAQPREAHNSYLEVAAESGIVAAVAFLVLVALAVAVPLRRAGALADAGHADRAGFARAVGAGVAGYATAALFLHQGFPEYTWLAVGLAALTAGLPGLRSDNTTSAAR